MAGALALQQQTVSADPGGFGVITAVVRNTGTIVEEFQLTVVGACEAWTTVEPATVSLFPNAEATVAVRFAPPRSASVAAGSTPFGLRITSATDPAFSRVEEGTVEVGGFTEVSARITPRTSEGSRAGSHEVVVENRGNAPVSTEITAIDPDDALAFRIQPPKLDVAPGAVGTSKVKVRAKTGVPKGSAKNRPFQVTILPAGGTATVLDGALSQTGGYPVGRILRVALPALAAVAIAAAVLSQTVLKSDDVSTAAPPQPSPTIKPPTTLASTEPEAVAPPASSPAPAPATVLTATPPTLAPTTSAAPTTAPAAQADLSPTTTLAVSRGPGGSGDWQYLWENTGGLTAVRVHEQPGNCGGTSGTRIQRQWTSGGAHSQIITYCRASTGALHLEEIRFDGATPDKSGIFNCGSLLIRPATGTTVSAGGCGTTTVTPKVHPTTTVTVPAGTYAVHDVELTLSGDLQGSYRMLFITDTGMVAQEDAKTTFVGVTEKHLLKLNRSTPS